MEFQKCHTAYTTLVLYICLGCDSDITQLSAVSEDATGRKYVFDCYIRPASGRIQRGASAVTGLRMRKGNMYYKGKKVM